MSSGSLNVSSRALHVSSNEKMAGPDVMSKSTGSKWAFSTLSGAGGTQRTFHVTTSVSPTFSNLGALGQYHANASNNFCS